MGVHSMRHSPATMALDSGVSLRDLPAGDGRGGVCVESGADEFAIDGWAEVGAERQAQAAIPPAGVRVI